MINWTGMLDVLTEYAAFFIIGCTLAGDKPENRTRSMPLVLCFSILQISISDFFLQFSVNAANILSHFIYLLLIYCFYIALFYHGEDVIHGELQYFLSKNKFLVLLNIFFLFACSCFVMILLKIFCIYFTMFVGNIQIGYLNIDSLANILLCIFGHMISQRVQPVLFYRQKTKNKLMPGIFLVNTFLIVDFIYLYQKITIGSVFDMFIIIITCCILLIFVNLILFYYNRLLESQEEQLNAFQTYMPVINSLIQDIRMRQHSYNNMIQAISMLPATHTDYETLTAALQEYTAVSPVRQQYTDILKLNLKLVAGFLVNKIQQAEEEGKELRLTLKNTEIHTFLPEYILIEIIGILTDNALEAVEKGESIYLEIDGHGDKLYMKIKNPGSIVTPEQRENFFKFGYTTKSQDKKSHGMGLARLRDIINANHGMIILSNETENEIIYVVFELEV